VFTFKWKWFLIGVAVCLYTFGIVWFFDRYRIQSPIIFRSPIVERYLSPLPIKSTPIEVSPVPTRGVLRRVTPTPTTRIPKKKVELLHTDIYRKIAILESGGGKAVGLSGYCQKQGKFNSIGYAPHLKYCFDSKTDEMRVLGNWFQAKFKQGYDLATSLCIWNVGKAVSSCDYSQNYLALK
jgi:hypothetical protein